MYSYNPYDSYYYNSNPVEEFFEDFFSSGGAAFVGIFLTIFMIIMAIVLVMSVVMYILSAFPLYKLAKKLNRPYAWLAWIPVLGMYFRAYVLCDLAGDKELVIIKDKIVIKDRKTSFLIYLGIVILGSAIVGVIVGLLSLIPIIGWLSFVLIFIPVICAGFMDYAYLRDVLDIFKEDKISNNTTAIVVTLLDCLISYGLARMIILFTLLNREPIVENVINCEATPDYANYVNEAPAYAQPAYTAPAYTAPTNQPAVTQPAVVETPVAEVPVTAEATPENTENNNQ